MSGLQCLCHSGRPGPPRCRTVRKPDTHSTLHKATKVCNNSCLTLRAIERRLLSLANNDLKLRGNVEIRDTNE